MLCWPEEKYCCVELREIVYVFCVGISSLIMIVNIYFNNMFMLDSNLNIE